MAFKITKDYLLGRIKCEIHAMEVDDPLGDCFNSHLVNIEDLRNQLRLLTKRVPDAGDSTASRSRIHASAKSKSRKVTKRTQRG